ncbi:hypothetical protein SBA4_4600012 [Candidatus Sulfopaludibacter sp. SbA4]|nr:hypothetical protein SBA4_4600012 [Candidatus Sulfopaludibacter sp. SbA4]
MISESKEGFIIAVTRQKAGRTGATAVGGAPGNGNAPGPADSAKVIVVSASFSDFSGSQGVCPIAIPGTTAKDAHRRYRFTWRTPSKPSFDPRPAQFYCIRRVNRPRWLAWWGRRFRLPTF